MLKSHEILGTNKVIFTEKEENFFSLRDLLVLGERPVDYEIVGYVKVLKYKEIFFEPVYLKLEGR